MWVAGGYALTGWTSTAEVFLGLRDIYFIFAIFLDPLSKVYSSETGDFCAGPHLDERCDNML